MLLGAPVGESAALTAAARTPSVSAEDGTGAKAIASHSVIPSPLVGFRRGGAKSGTQGASSRHQPFVSGRWEVSTAATDTHYPAGRLAPEPPQKKHCVSP